MGFIIVVVIIVAIGFWFVNTQQRLVRLDELCKNALSQIGVQQNSRWDALTALADLTKAYADHEYNTMKDVIGLRTSVNQNSTAEQVNGQEQAMGLLMGRLLAVAEAYPQLRANETYIETMNSVKDYEENVRMSRMVYNDVITKFNSAIRMFPTSLIAGTLGFAERGYLEEPVGKTEMPSMVR